MTIDRVNRWLTLVTNVGVILGLAVVVYEVRQNTLALYNEADVAVMALSADRTSAILESGELANLVSRSRTADWADFPGPEKFRLEILWGSLVDQLQLQFRLWNRRGDPLLREDIVFPFRLLENKLFREFWGRAQSDYHSDFVVFFDDLMADSGPR